MTSPLVGVEACLDIYEYRLISAENTKLASLSMHLSKVTRLDIIASYYFTFILS
jgi:hypothetical protein